MQQENLVEELEREFRAHARLEEELFHSRDGSAQALSLEAEYAAHVEEHRQGDALLEELLATEQPDELARRARELGEWIAEHAAEEEKELFPRLRQTIGPNLPGRAENDTSRPATAPKPVPLKTMRRVK